MATGGSNRSRRVLVSRSILRFSSVWIKVRGWRPSSLAGLATKKKKKEKKLKEETGNGFRVARVHTLQAACKPSKAEASIGEEENEREVDDSFANVVADA